MDTLLRYGISGYWWENGEIRPTVVDFSKFETICHDVMGQYSGKVLEIRNVKKIGTGNYHLAYLKQQYVSDQAIVLFLNIHYPFIAVKTTPLDETSNDIFGPSNSWQKVTQVIKQSDVIFRFRLIYRFLEPVELKEPLTFSHNNTDKQLQLLNRHEMPQKEVEMIHKWQRISSIPLTVGDVIFNWWD
ncbi:MAG: hypothetical protein IPJ90_20660 [Anaerolineaceae bacterium]|nr:hypothetical protein [Anaerolineaceae bacterium]